MGNPVTEEAEGWGTASTGIVVPAELFLDLVFVFCMTQVTRLVAADLHWLNMLRGLLMVSIIWTVWVGFAWIGNMVPEAQRTNVEHIGVFRVLLAMTVASLIILGMSIPRGFGEDSWIFIGAFLAITVLYVLSYLYVTRGSAKMRRNFLAMLPLHLMLPVSLVASAIINRLPWSPLLIIAGLLVAMTAHRITDRDAGWRVDIDHADERFRLFIFIVLGETIIAIGSGASESDFGVAVVASVICGVVFCTTLWWIYFRLVAFHGVRHLTPLSRHQSARATRVVYTYLHGVLVVIATFLAVGLEAAAAHPLQTLNKRMTIVSPLSLALFIVVVYVIHYLLSGVKEWALLIPAGLLLFAMPLGRMISAVWVQAICAGVLLVFVLGRELIRNPVLAGSRPPWANRE